MMDTLAKSLQAMTRTSRWCWRVAASARWNISSRLYNRYRTYVGDITSTAPCKLSSPSDACENQALGWGGLALLYVSGVEAVNRVGRLYTVAG